MSYFDGDDVVEEVKSQFVFASDSVQIVSRYNRLRPIADWLKDLPKDPNSAITKLCEMKMVETDSGKLKEIVNEIVIRVFFLLPHHAKKHAGKLFMKLPHSVFEDAVQNMALNVLSAIEKFDPYRGTKFSNYILMYLQDGLFKSIRQNNVVSPSVIRKHNMESLKLTDSELEDEDLDDNYALQRDRVKQGAMSIVHGQVEFEDGTMWAIDEAYAPEAVDVIESVYNEEITLWLKHALDPKNGVLTEDEAMTIKHHFGVFGCSKLRLKDIAAIRKTKGKGHAATRIFQIENDAINKLKKFFKRMNLTYEI